MKTSLGAKCDPQTKSRSCFSAALIFTGYRRIFAHLQISVTVTDLIHHIWHLRGKGRDEGSVPHHSEYNLYLIQTKHFFSLCVCARAGAVSDSFSAAVN